MKKLYLIGNMKMNMNYADLEPYFANLTQVAENTSNVVGVCVPSVYLDFAKYSLENSKVLFGAQNMYHEDKGAYTGEISAHMLNDFSCDLVILGHSERRNIFHESDEDINLKVKKALAEGLTPILCFGEVKEEREGGMAFSVVERQLMNGLNGLDTDEINRIIFAYEPVWAIGTGLSATPDQAEEMIAFTKRLLHENFECHDNIVLYGGSLKASNANEILSKPSIDGGLIGGACLKIDEFEQIINTKVDE
ncbi:MAG: triose-phosphate isomerase [Clostridiales bacterium]|nr:triose-phosphate isomerase [Clostridiales bacterium]